MALRAQVALANAYNRLMNEQNRLREEYTRHYDQHIRGISEQVRPRELLGFSTVRMSRTDAGFDELTRTRLRLETLHRNISRIEDYTNKIRAKLLSMTRDGKLKSRRRKKDWPDDDPTGLFINIINPDHINIIR